MFNNYTERNLSQNSRSGQFLHPHYEEIDQNALQLQDISATNAAFFSTGEKKKKKNSHFLALATLPFNPPTHAECNRFIILPCVLSLGILGHVGRHSLTDNSVLLMTLEQVFFWQAGRPACPAGSGGRLLCIMSCG